MAGGSKKGNNDHNSKSYHLLKIYEPGTMNKLNHMYYFKFFIIPTDYCTWGLGDPVR